MGLAQRAAVGVPHHLAKVRAADPDERLVIVDGQTIRIIEEKRELKKELKVHVVDMTVS